MSSGDKATREGYAQTASLKARARADRMDLLRRALERDPGLRPVDLDARFGWKSNTAARLMRDLRRSE